MLRRRVGRWLLVGVVAVAAFQVARLVLPCKPRMQIPFDGWIEDLTFSPDGALLVTNEGFHVRVWDCKTGHLRADLMAQNLSVVSVAVAPDDRRVAALTIQGDCIIWEMASGLELSKKPLERFPENASGSIGFGSDGRLFAVSPEGVKVWDGTTGSELRSRLPSGHVAFHVGSIVGIEGTQTPSLDVFDLATDDRVAILPPKYDDWWPFMTVFAPRAGIVASAWPNAEEVMFFDIASGRVRSIRTNLREEILNWPRISLSPDGEQIVIGPCDPSPAGGGPLALLKTTLPERFAEALEPVSSAQVPVYRTFDGREQVRLPGDKGVFSPDGGTLLVIDRRISVGIQVPGATDTKLNLYDVPFRGPWHQALVLGFLAGALTYVLASRLSRSGGRRQPSEESLRFAKAVSTLPLAHRPR